MAIARWFVAALLPLVLVPIACTPARPVNAASLKPDKDRKTAPDFELKDVNGKSVRLSDFRGKVVVLDFWATWCGPCKIEIPWFVEFERKYKDKGFAVLGVSEDEDGWTSVKPFVKEVGINYRVVIGNDRTTESFGGIEGLPTTFVIDREGKIAAVHVGLASKQDFEDAIEKLLQTSGESKRAALDARAGSARAE